MKPGFAPKLKRLLLKENSILRAYALPEELLKSQQVRQDFMRRWQKAAGSASIFIWQPQQIPQALLLLQNSPCPSSASRILLYPSQNTKLQAQDYLDLCQELFSYFPTAYDLELDLVTPEAPSPELLGQLRDLGIDYWQRKSHASIWPQISWGLYLRRLQLLSPLIHIPFHDFGIILTENSQQDHIIGVDFVHKGQICEPGALAFLLNDLGLLDQNQRYKPLPAARLEKTLPVPNYSALLLEAERQIQAYLQGQLTELTLPYEIIEGTAFQRQVWSQMSKIPYGTAWSYSDLAAQLVGPEKARTYARAIGRACGANPLPLLIPCHRVIGQDGQLVGFTGGVEIKERLLNMELLTYHP
ncbi:MAG: methylated-DNA--[protein]-cysteine S-methyltransferase [Eubacteriales bacterium]|nr:methylated-DNA--[protein]-cysteine S-methyltransferase [Eubacteriales bacterium]